MGVLEQQRFVQLLGLFVWMACTETGICRSALFAGYIHTHLILFEGERRQQVSSTTHGIIHPFSHSGFMKTFQREWIGKAGHEEGSSHSSLVVLLLTTMPLT